MKQTDFDSLKNNIIEDIKKCNHKQTDEIYQALHTTLKKFDRDSVLKNIFDFFGRLLKTKKEKCIHFVEDIVDSRDKLNSEEKELLRKTFLDISNIHRTLIENIISLIDSL